MAQEPKSSSRESFLAQHASFIEALCVEAQCARWELPHEKFAEALHRSMESRFHGAAGSVAEIQTYLKSLRVQDLALACACSEGIETAWEFFIGSYRQELRNASRAILRASGSADDARAEELADSLYAELYGVRSNTDARRKSLFEYFHGRSKLSTWLRAVLAQRHVDLLRSGVKTISLDTGRERDAPSVQEPHVEFTSTDPDREKYLARFDRALSMALAELLPRERLILACYYVDQLTLAEIGRILREHESTVSRQMERSRRALRENVTQRLLHSEMACDGGLAEPGLSAAQVDLAFEYVLEDWPFDLSRALSKEVSGADPPER